MCSVNMSEFTVQASPELNESCTEDHVCSPLMTVKDELIDVDYDKALNLQPDNNHVKVEAAAEDGETVSPPDELRISSVFSVSGTTDAISGISSAAQAPLSLSKDVPVIGGVVSLASALAGNTALTGALPTSNASSEIISDISPAVITDSQQEIQNHHLDNNTELSVKLESEWSSESDSEPETGGNTFQARDGTVWVDYPLGKPRDRPRKRRVRETPGPTPDVKARITNPLSSWLCLIDEEILDKIQQNTLAEAARNKADFTLTPDELKGFLGLVYLRGITGGKVMKLDDYWSTDLGNPIFMDTIARQKFRDIMRYLCFDDKRTRASRLLKDKFALISEVFDKFVKNSISSYTPGENITVDEHLFPTKARCSFTQYMAHKPGKFGIKFWVAADAETKYMLNSIPYLGKEDRPAVKRLSENIVSRLVRPFLGKGRNVTTDLVTLPLANFLLKNKTTIVGTVSKNRREMPACAQEQSERFSSKVLKSGKAVLTIYQSKPKDNICILSTAHRQVLTDNGFKKMPETLIYYNSTKRGVDVMHQMARLYTVKGGTRRWPLAVFYNILDLAAINAHILYKQSLKVKISRRRFILELVKELCREQKQAKAAAALAAAHKRVLPDGVYPPAKRKQCQVGRCSGNKTFDICHTCRRFVCGKCTKPAPKLCYDC